MNDFKIEICTNSAESCIRAEQGGAYRVELCAGIPEGGTTPSYGEIAVARESVRLKLHVIIRPRGGDFFYSEKEIQAMIHDIKVCKSLGVDGVTFGCLTTDGKVDVEKNRKLIEAAEDMSCTFHQAFDHVEDPFQSLEEIIALGFSRLLTSGQKKQAIDGADLLQALNVQADGRIIIMPGGGVNQENIVELSKHTGSHEFHFTAWESTESPMTFRSLKIPMNSSLTKSDYILLKTDPKLIAKTIQQLHQPGDLSK